jgi:hypothetical protein
MKRLALVVMVIAATFVTVAMASAQDGWGAVQGTYGLIAPGSCLHSIGGFKSTQPPFVPNADSHVWGATTLALGTVTFKADGTGTVSGTNYIIDFPPGGPNPPLFDSPAARQAPFALSFRYDVENGAITVTFSNNIVAAGSISQDHKTITLVSANQVQPFVVNGTQYGSVVCDTGRTLIRMGE